MKKLLAALLALLCLPVMTALGDTQGDFTYALTPEGAVVTMYYVEDAAQTPAVIKEAASGFSDILRAATGPVSGGGAFQSPF